MPLSALARDRTNLKGANHFSMCVVALQKRNARSSPCSDLAPNGKVPLKELEGFSAATSGQILVPASRLFVYSLQDPAESHKKVFSHRMSVQSIPSTSA